MAKGYTFSKSELANTDKKINAMSPAKKKALAKAAQQTGVGKKKSKNSR